MITLYAFGRVHPGMIGEGRDLRAQWALEETGLPYRVHGLDYIAGELDAPAYSRLSCFQQVPVIDDDGFIVGESGAVLLYIAEKAGKLIPADFTGRTRVVQWCFAALATVERPLFEIQMIDGGIGGEWARERRWSRKRAACSPGWSAGSMAANGSPARRSRSPTFSSPPSCGKSANTDLLEPYPRLRAYYARALARPGWQRTLSFCAERQGVTVADIR